VLPLAILIHEKRLIMYCWLVFNHLQWWKTWNEIWKLKKMISLEVQQHDEAESHIIFLCTSMPEECFYVTMTLNIEPFKII
jgi:cell division protein FtsL